MSCPIRPLFSSAPAKKGGRGSLTVNQVLDCGDKIALNIAAHRVAAGEAAEAGTHNVAAAISARGLNGAHDLREEVHGMLNKRAGEEGVRPRSPTGLATHRCADGAIDRVTQGGRAIVAKGRHSEGGGGEQQHNGKQGEGGAHFVPGASCVKSGHSFC